MIPTVLAAHAMTQESKTEVTVYNQGLGFIKDVRTVDFKAGLQQFVVDDVARQIDATSVGFKCLSNPGSISILEQNYQYDLLSPQSILEKSVGKRIRFTRTMGNEKESVMGTLISSPTSVVNTGNGSEYSYNGLVIRTDDGRILLSPQGEIDVLEIPEGLITKPSLLWQLESLTGQRATVELSYLTQGMKWNANYVLTLGEGGAGDLQGWATIDNQSGVSFKDATLKLLAGDVNVLRKQPLADMEAQDSKLKFDRSAANMTESSLFEYHLYTLNRPATIRDKESKQLGLLEGHNISVNKVVSFDGYFSEGNAVPVQDMAAKVKVKFLNTEKNHLGMPMPAGKVRLYQRDAHGSLQFLGEDAITHTPRDEKVALGVGSAFDVKASRKPISYKKLTRNSARTDIEVEVRNRKQEPVTVYLYEHFSGDWKITSKSQDYLKEDASTAVFEVKLQPGEVRKVSYSVDTKW